MRLNLGFILAFGLTILSSCGKEPKAQEEPKKDAAPALVSTNPENGAKDLAVKEVDIVFVFDQNVTMKSDNQSKITISPEANITKVSAYKTAFTVTLTDLSYDTKYTITVPDGVIEGTKLNQDKAKGVSYSFTTQPAPVIEEYEDVPTPGDNRAWDMLRKLGLGWNLGNQFDAYYSGTWAGEDMLFVPNETVWGNEKVTKETFINLTEAGFSSVRIPITWLKMIGEAPEYKIDEGWMSRIKEVVGWARDAGLVVIINTHHDEDHYYGSEEFGHKWLNIIDATTDESLNESIKDKIKGVWTNIANEFKDEGDYLIFEGFNEINDGRWGSSKNTPEQAAILNQWNQVFVDAVRATGGNNPNRWISVPPYCAGPNYLKYFTLPEDPSGRLMVAIHCYDPYNFTLAPDLPQKKWGHTFNNNPKDEQAIRTLMRTIYDDYVAKDIPIYLGEFGCSFREYGTSEWRNFKYYLEFFVKAAKSYGIPCLVWDNGNKGFGSEHHAYIDHATGKYVGNSKEVIDLMVKAMYSEDKYYTLRSIYETAPKE